MSISPFSLSDVAAALTTSLVMLIVFTGSPGLAQTIPSAENTSAKAFSNVTFQIDRSSVPLNQINTERRYIDFLEFLDRPQRVRVSFSRPVVRRHLDALTAVLPDSLSQPLGIVDAAQTGNVNALSPSAGARLHAWWNRRDPYPATVENERLLEHLSRTRVAFDKYHREDDDDRLDDRGLIYVRLGGPDRKMDLDALHGGEFWVYGFDAAAEFVFIRDRGKGYNLGIPTDFLPRHARRGMGPTGRGMRKAIGNLSLLEAVYGNLSHYRSRYGMTYSDLSMYKEQIRIALNGFSPPFNVSPDTYVKQKLEEIRIEEHHVAQQRKEVLPRTRSSVGNDLQDLTPATRWIRTMSEDGTTNVDVYWSLPQEASGVPDDVQEKLDEAGVQPTAHHLLTSSLVGLSGAYERLTMKESHVLVSAREAQQGRAVETQRSSFVLDKNLAHAALQVDKYWASVDWEDNTISRVGKVGGGTRRADGLEPLTSDPNTLEMSDLAPIVPSDSVSLSDAPVYPFETVSPSTPLALRFHLYHLAKDASGRTTYSVTYTAQKQTKRNRFVPLLERQESSQTGVTSTFEGKTSRTEEVVLLDTDTWSLTKAQAVFVTVTVKDQQGNQQVQRTIRFNIQQ